MDNSIFIAQILGIIYLVIGLGLVLNTDFYLSCFRRITDEPIFIYFGGVIALLVGLLILNSNNIWEQDWRLVITILGWMATIKGIFLLVFPNLALRVTARFFEGKTKILFSAYFALGLGLMLTSIGFSQG